jgi:oligopeptide/dipeptide ABC transporter ATP-binding protein
MTADLSIRNLVVDYEMDSRYVRALDSVELDVEGGETIGIVGESGSGKSTLGLTIGRLLPPNAQVRSGEVLIQGRDVYGLTNDEIRKLRMDLIGFVFQDPLSALDPTISVGRQMANALGRSAGTNQVDADLRRVGLSDLDRIKRSYPHQLSGGLAQRVAIAIAIARRPRIVVADEPTASLDASLRAQIMELLMSLPNLLGASILLLSHDLRAIEKYCQRMAVMYGGRIVEAGASDTVFRRPAHPYTQALFRAAPGFEAPGSWIAPIQGIPPLLFGRSANCAFAQRCDWVTDTCRTVRPEPNAIEGRMAVCHRAQEVVRSTTGSGDKP